MSRTASWNAALAALSRLSPFHIPHPHVIHFWLCKGAALRRGAHVGSHESTHAARP